MVHEYFLLSFHVTVISKLANEVSQKICKDALSCHNISSGKPFSNAVVGHTIFCLNLNWTKITTKIMSSMYLLIFHSECLAYVSKNICNFFIFYIYFRLTFFKDKLRGGNSLRDFKVCIYALKKLLDVI